MKNNNKLAIIKNKTTLFNLLLCIKNNDAKNPVKEIKKITFTFKNAKAGIAKIVPNAEPDKL